MMEIASVEFISSVGFPICAYFYTAYKLEGTLQENTKAITALREELHIARKLATPS